MNTRPITENCQRILNSKLHVCFGISPFNSYFSDQKIEELALWGKGEFKATHFFVPDVPSAYTLEALGYPPEKAAWKARRQAQYLRNKIHKVLSNIGYSIINAEEMFLDWEKLSKNNHYLFLFQEVTKHFELNSDFRKACLEASKWVLEKRTPDTECLTPETLESAARYLLAEIPLFLDTAGIVGVKSSVFCYHQCIPFLENLFRNRFPLKVAPNQGFVVIEPIIQKELYPLNKIKAVEPFERN
ncbi:MAG: tRNA-dependent cyclodipeptide synthase [Bdellovibrionia bacterium]